MGLRHGDGKLSLSSGWTSGRSWNSPVRCIFLAESPSERALRGGDGAKLVRPSPGSWRQDILVINAVSAKASVIRDLVQDAMNLKRLRDIRGIFRGCSHPSF